MTLVGGAVAPVIMGYIADTTGSMEIAFLIPLVCHGVIGGYAFSNHSVSSLAQCIINNKVKNMNYKKSPLDLFLQQRLEEDGQILRTTLDISLQKEMTCISEIQNGIKTCKEKISLYNKSIEKATLTFIPIMEKQKNAFADNLHIWNTMGHIQMASIEMKEYIKRLTSQTEEWQQRDTIKLAYVSIYETSKKIEDYTSKIMKFLNKEFCEYDSTEFKDVRKRLTTFRESNKTELKHIRNTVAAHRDEDICLQIETIEGIHLSEALKLIAEYGSIVNQLGMIMTPIRKLGLIQLENIFGKM